MIDGFPDGVPGVDIYHGDNVVSFHALTDAGIVFVAIKAVQGTGEVDPSHGMSLSRAREAGLLPASYEFFTYADPIREARHFVDNAGDLRGQLPLIVDVETYWNGAARDALANCLEVKRLTGRFPIVYSSLYFWETYLKPIFPVTVTLYIADYDVKRPPIPCSFFQFTSGRTLPGVSAPLDCDVYTGTVDQLRAMRG